LNEVLANSDGRDAGSRSAAVGVALSSPSRDGEAKLRIGDTVRRWCLESLGPRLKAVVLTGSLARNEATWRQSGHFMQFLSDAEFIVILNDPRLRRVTARAKRRLAMR